MAAVEPPQCNDTKLNIDCKEPKLTTEGGKVIDKLKELYLETINLDVEMHSKIFKLEMDYTQKRDVFFEKRKKILSELRKRGDADNEYVPYFWLNVLRASYSGNMTMEDEEILRHLIDMRTDLVFDTVVKFTLKFYFEPNVFFENELLTKTYYMNTKPDKDDPISFDGAEIYRCTGCEIKWKQPREESDSDNPSFFDFFSPKEVPTDLTDPNFRNVHAELQTDFEIGFYFKERVIPKAILFFTGEIPDCDSVAPDDMGGSEAEGDDDDDVDDDGAAADDDDGNGGDETFLSKMASKLNNLFLIGN